MHPIGLSLSLLEDLSIDKHNFSTKRARFDSSPFLILSKYLFLFEPVTDRLFKMYFTYQVQPHLFSISKRLFVSSLLSTKLFLAGSTIRFQFKPY